MSFSKGVGMRKMPFLVVFFVVFGLLLPCVADAVDWSVEPYIKGGSVNWVENGVSEGNKSLLGGGLKVNTIFGDFSGTVILEKAQIAEGMDEDREIPNRFYAIGAEVAYKLVNHRGFLVSPYAGVAYENWDREISNPKICGSWEDINFFSWTLGAKVDYKQVYVKAGAILPFAIDTNRNSFNPKPRVGYQAEIGANIWKGLNTAVQYRSLQMGGPHSKLNTTTLMVGYRIPI